MRKLIFVKFVVILFLAAILLACGGDDKETNGKDVVAQDVSQDAGQDQTTAPDQEVADTASADIPTTDLPTGPSTDKYVDSSNPSHYKVYPMKKPVADSEDGSDAIHLQWAVDNVAERGTVEIMMKDLDGDYSVFDLTDGYLDIKRAVTIKGEKNGSTKANEWTDAAGGNNVPFTCIWKDETYTIQSDRAVILGGFGGGGEDGYSSGAFYINNAGSGVVTVSGLRFERSGASSVQIEQCNGVVISDNVITNPEPKYFAGADMYLCGGIMGTGDPLFFDPNPPDWLRGDIIVEENYLDIVGPNGELVYPPNTAPAGIGFFETDSAAKFYIRDNLVKNPGVAGIIIPGTPNAEGWIERNIIYQRDYENGGGGYGISIYSHFGRMPGTFHITGNTLNNMTYIGIELWEIQPTTTVSNNTIKMAQGFMGIMLGSWLTSGCNGAVIDNNTIEGVAEYGINTYDKTYSSTFEIYKENMADLTLAEFVSEEKLDPAVPGPAHLYLGTITHDNIINLHGFASAEEIIIVNPNEVDKDFDVTDDGGNILYHHTGCGTAECDAPPCYFTVLNMFEIPEGSGAIYWFHNTVNPDGSPGDCDTTAAPKNNTTSLIP